MYQFKKREKEKKASNFVISSKTQKKTKPKCFYAIINWKLKVVNHLPRKVPQGLGENEKLTKSHFTL